MNTGSRSYKTRSDELEVVPDSGRAHRQPCIPTHQPLAARMSEPLHIVCPHCHTTNRMSADQLGSAPDCGQCKQPLFTGKPVNLAEAAFDKHLQRNQIPLLVDFWAPC